MIESIKLIKGNFKVGDRIRETLAWHDLATITAITEKGFEYKYDKTKSLIPRWGMSTDGGECYESGFYYWEIIKETEEQIELNLIYEK
jgi:hypothetical protein